MKSLAYAVALVAGAALTLSACSEGPREGYDPEATKPKERLQIENARLILPAVSGNPAVVYFDLTYISGGGPTIEGVVVDGAQSAEIHATETVDGNTTMGKAIPLTLWANQKRTFEPGGFHIMVMGPSDTLKAGEETNVTVKLSNGEEFTAAVPIQAAGDDR